MLKLDIACGKNKKNGFVGVDIWDGADIIVDLEKFPWPFPDNSVDEIFCSHYIEHTPDLISFANELYRIMKVGAKAEIIAPYYSSIRAWQDPTHLRAISENTFLYFNKEWRNINKLDHYPIVADFDFESSYIIDRNWSEKDTDELKFAIKYYINVVSDINTILTKRDFYSEELEEKIRKIDELWESGEYEYAASICREIDASSQGNLEIYLKLADYEYKQNKINDSIVYFRQALALDEESLQANAGLIRALIITGKIKDAELHLDKINKMDAELANIIKTLIDSSIA